MRGEEATGPSHFFEDNKKDVKQLERVQRRITKTFLRLRKVSYEGKLTELKLLSLSKLRMWGDLIGVLIKIFKGFDNINAEDYISVHQSYITRKRNCFMIIDKRLSTNDAKHFFNWVINVWSYLPISVANSITVQLHEHTKQVFSLQYAIKISPTKFNIIWLLRLSCSSAMTNSTKFTRLMWRWQWYHNNFLFMLYHIKTS